MNADVRVTGGVGSLAGTPAISANHMSVNLTHVANAQTLMIALSSIMDIQGQSLPDTNVKIDFLLGDTNGDNVVNLIDVNQTNGRVGQVVTDSNFRSDVNADGTLTAVDVTLVKQQIGNGIPVPSRPPQEVASERDGGCDPEYLRVATEELKPAGASARVTKIP